MGYIYIISNDINNKKYIGKTSHTIDYRWKLHLTQYPYVKCPLYSAFNKYGVEHFSVKKIEECDNNILSEREIYWIKFYDSYNNGYNATLGGEGCTKYDYDKVLQLWKQGYHIQQIANKLNGNRHVIGNILHDLGITKEEIYHRGAGNNRKMVGQFSLDGILLKIYPSASEASRQTGAPQPNISKCCRGESNTCHGYIWQYLNLTEHENQKYEILKEYQK